MSLFNFDVCRMFSREINLGDDMINALRYKERLEESGFTPEQAKNSVDIWMSLINENFATKADMREYQLVNKSELKEVQNELKNDIKDLKTDLEGKIKDLKNENLLQFKTMKSEIIFKLGGLMLGLFTISTSIISILISKM